MDSELELGLTALFRNERNAFARCYSALRRGLGNSSRVAWLYSLSIMSVAVWSAFLIVAIAKDQQLQSAIMLGTLFVLLGAGVALVVIGFAAAVRPNGRTSATPASDLRTAKYAPMGSNTIIEKSRVETSPEAVNSIATAFHPLGNNHDDVTNSVKYVGDIISSLSIGLLVIDDNGQIRMANAAFRSMAGFSVVSTEEDHLIGMQLVNLLGNADGANRRLPDVRGKGVEKILKSQNGREIPVVLVSTPLPASDPIKGKVFATIDISERKLAEEHVRAGRERIESLVQHMHEIQDMERSRIARDLHDDLGAVLTALRNGLVRLCGLVGNETRTAASDLVELADNANTSVDRVIKNLWPQMLDHFGLDGALEALTVEFENTHSIATSCSIEVGQMRFDKRVELALYRTSQEALTNIAKHAHARSAHISLKIKDCAILLEIRDDGHGFVKRNHQDQKGGYGLLGMRQRIAAVGGEVLVTTGVKGSEIGVKVPLVLHNANETTPRFRGDSNGK
jgi:PAS domain S-box-containing protein